MCLVHSGTPGVPVYRATGICQRSAMSGTAGRSKTMDPFAFEGGVDSSEGCVKAASAVPPAVLSERKKHFGAVPRIAACRRAPPCGPRCPLISSPATSAHMRARDVRLASGARSGAKRSGYGRGGRAAHGGRAVLTMAVARRSCCPRAKRCSCGVAPMRPHRQQKEPKQLRRTC